MNLNFPEEISEKTFLQNYWQKQPLLIRNALPDYRFPLQPDELAGLACDHEIESRIVLEKDGSRPWEARQGPFNEKSFQQLPASHWTLLVQDVDKHLPEVARLLQAFRFIPDWRLDDIMASYAVDQGSVGPHIDDYDVFLLQAAGYRKWHIDTRETSEAAYIPGLDLRILPNFAPEHSWLLKPGDILYLPPNVAHWGVAVGDDCITCSVGYQAPALKEMVSDWCNEMVQTQVPGSRYRDRELLPQQLSAEISQHVLQQIGNDMEQYLKQDPEHRSRWFGRFVTEPKVHLQVEPTEPAIDGSQFQNQLLESGMLSRNGWSRFAFIRGIANRDYLYVNGDEFPLAKENHLLLEMVSNQHLLNYDSLKSWIENPDCLAFLTNLYNEGHLHFP
ncbi:MAG: cupin domain-containing protein [Gammaproteobacteria bacterium]|nr:cupin domain-containing protein [Gammaproteobacteria bacterium]